MPVFLFDLSVLCSFCNAVSLSFRGLIVARYSPRLRNLLTVRFARRQEGNFLHDDGGELGRGAELSLLFWGNRSAPSWPPPFMRPIVLSANAVPPCHTHVLGRGDRAGIKHANTIDISLIDVPAFRPRPCHQTADLRNHVVWLMERRR